MFYRLVFVSFLKEKIDESGISGYLTIQFVLFLLIEFIISKKEGAEKNVYIKTTLKKAWTSVFYFRFEDTMV